MRAEDPRLGSGSKTGFRTREGRYGRISGGGLQESDLRREEMEIEMTGDAPALPEAEPGNSGPWNRQMEVQGKTRPERVPLQAAFFCLSMYS